MDEFENLIENPEVNQKSLLRKEGSVNSIPIEIPGLIPQFLCHCYKSIFRAGPSYFVTLVYKPPRSLFGYHH